MTASATPPRRRRPGPSERELLQRARVAVGLTGRLPAVDHAFPRAAEAVAELADVTLLGLLPHRLQAHADAELVDGDVADVDADDRLIGAVEQDRRPDVPLGLLLPV